MGINWNLSDETSNDLMTGTGDLPWIQDTSEINIRAAWEAGYRDVILLDPWNRPIGMPYNLSTFDLSVEANRDDLKDRLRQAAVLVDSDGDRIGDDWEERYFAGLGNGVESDPDQDGGDHFLEYAMGSDPSENGSRPAVLTGFENEHVTLTYRRRLGVSGGLKYDLEWSATGETWADVSQDFVLEEASNTFDGSGTEVVKYVSVEERERLGFYRVRVGFENAP